MTQGRPKDRLIRAHLDRLIAEGQPGDRLPRIRDLMQSHLTSQRVVQRAIAPLIAAGRIQARPGAGMTIAEAAPSDAARYRADCLILYRGSDSRLARTLLIELVARLRRRGRRVVTKGFVEETRAIAYVERQGPVRCCLLQTNFETVSVRFLAKIKQFADALVIDGVSVTGLDADVIGTNWREALSVGYRDLRAQGHDRIGFLTSSHDARQIAMARREFLLLSEWEGPAPHPRLHTVPRLPGAYRHDDLLAALPDPHDPEAATALIVWGLVDGYMLDAALHEKGLRAGADVSLLLLGSVDVASEHVSRFDVVGNSDADKLDLFLSVVTSRIDGSATPPRAHYLPIYRRLNGAIELLMATSQG